MSAAEGATDTVFDEDTQRLARVYGTALHDAAEKAGQADAVLTELNDLVDGLFKQQPELERFLGSAAVREPVKAEAIDRAFRGRASDLLLDFLHVLNRHHRLDRLRAVARFYQTLRDEAHHRTRVRVRSARPLSDRQLDAIRQTLHSDLHMEPVLDVTVDDSLLGGLVLSYRGRVFDGSVRTQLETIRNQLLAGSSHAIQSRRDRFSHPG